MMMIDEDLFEIEELYNQFIEMMVDDFINDYDINVKNALLFINQIYKNIIVQNKKEEYPNIDNISNLGIYSLYGFQVCRSTNKLLYDYMNLIGFNVNLRYIFIDNNNDWHIVEPKLANHIVVNMKDDESDKYFDLHSNLYFEKSNDKINSIKIDDYKSKINLYQYKSIINKINKKFDKYLLLEKMGVEIVYSYRY